MWSNTKENKIFEFSNYTRRNYNEFRITFR